MTFSELKRFDEAYHGFLRSLNRKPEVVVKYYELIGQSTKRCYALIGYETNDFGKYGIHYNQKRRAFYFGTINTNGKSWVIGLSFSQVERIPAILKKGFFEVAEAKKGKIIKRLQRGNEGLKEWI